MPTALQIASDWQWDGKKSAAADGKVIGTFKHSITHHKIHVTVVQANLVDKDVRWISEKDIQEQLVTSLDKKAWLCFQKSRQPHI